MEKIELHFWEIMQAFLARCGKQDLLENEDACNRIAETDEFYRFAEGY